MKQPFEHVVGEHGATVLRVCRALVGPHDAEDAWSETFVAALRAYPDLPADARVEAWLVTIARRKCIDLARARARRPVPVDELPDDRLAAGRVAHGGEPGDRRFLEDRELWAAVGALSDRQRQAVALHFVAGMPYAEVAAVLGGTADAARRAAADGIRRLRATLATPEQEEAGR